MRLLEFCTLTGADDSIDQRELCCLSEQYPFVEWGVLLHIAHMGSGRYPSLRWIEELCKKMMDFPRAHFALHICGLDALQDFLHGNGSVSRVASYFPRIQLNLVAQKIDGELLIAALRKHSDKTIITQHNAANEGLLRLLTGHTNHAVLFDESGGRGVSPSHWHCPLPGKRCGYAGGLGPENLEFELPGILKASEASPFWIDMEGKLRNADDQFDLSKARHCLSICSKFAVQVSAMDAAGGEAPTHSWDQL